MQTKKRPTKNANSQSGEMVRLIIGVGGVLGLILGLLGTFIGIVEWPLERKLILGGLVLLVLLIVEILFWNQRRKRQTTQKLPWLISLFVDVTKELDPDAKKVLNKERVFQTLRWTFSSLLVTILFASGLGLGEKTLRNLIDPPALTPTFTQTPSNTASPTITFTFTPIPTATPKEQGIYYMFVLDASLRMTESFEVQSKWDSALRAVDSLLVGLEGGANFGLVAIGGAPNAGISNPCEAPEGVTVPFTSREAVGAQVGQLQPGGGGSLYKAFVLARNQFTNLPENSVKTLIYITGSEDNCEGHDEWEELARYFEITENTAGLNIYSEIIIIDDKNGIKTQTIAERLSSISEQVNAQAPQTVFQLLQSNTTVINNVTNYVNTTIAAQPTNPPTITPTASRTNTPRPGETIIIPPTEPPTLTPTNTPTFTPTSTKTVTPSITPLPPFICQSTSPYIDTASFGGSAWINAPAPCTTGITAGDPISASGGYTDLPPNTIIWIFVYPPNGPFYPQSPNACGGSPSPYPVQGGGGWSVPVYFGNLGESSKSYDLVVMVTDQAGSDYIGQKLFQDCSNGVYDGISAGELAGINITTKAVLTVQTR